MKTRCKMKCVEVGQVEGYGDNPILNNVKLDAVYSGGEENKAFWDATPSGSLQFSSIYPGKFEVGKEYYIDIQPAPVDEVIES